MLWLLCPQIPGLIPPRQWEAVLSSLTWCLGMATCWEFIHISTGRIWGSSCHQSFPNPSQIALAAPSNSGVNIPNCRIHNSRSGGDLPNWKFLSEVLPLPAKQQRSSEHMRSLPLGTKILTPSLPETFSITIFEICIKNHKLTPEVSHCKRQYCCQEFFKSTWQQH